tara:strand:+ start:595 stop:960 length:366 start_codon:yes stop_codon:yes gene_type:complete
MSSTKNLNSEYNYIVEKKQNLKKNNYTFDKIYHELPHKYNMFNLGSNPSKMSRDNFSYNSVDIESKLRGIKSCNLEGSNFDPESKYKTQYSIDIFNNNLKNNLSVPESFIHKSYKSGFHNV